MRNCTAEEDGVAWLMRSEDAADLEAVWSRRFMVAMLLVGNDGGVRLF